MEDNTKLNKIKKIPKNKSTLTSIMTNTSIYDINESITEPFDYSVKDTTEPIKAKRGRKPKSTLIPVIKTKENQVETPIIVHLPIDYMETIKNNDINENCNMINYDSNDIFIKSESVETIRPIDKENKILKNKIDELTEKLNKYEKINKPCINPLINNSSKCWWCKYNYTTPTVELTEHYYNNMFYTSGYYCSYNCAMAYNIDINDENVSKRNSLLYLHYKKTYNNNILLYPSPSWKILKDFGGSVDIKEYRDNLIANKINYMYIKPPFVSRISYVEKTPINEEIPIIKSNEYVLKRTKPLNNTKYSLETTIGLKKIINVA